MRLDRGICVVRVHAGKEVGHCILVNRFQKHLLDSFDSYLMHLSVTALHLCGGASLGGYGREANIAEVQELYNAMSAYSYTDIKIQNIMRLSV